MTLCILFIGLNCCHKCSIFYKLFGIGSSNTEQTEQLLAEEGFSIFTVSKRKYLGDAGGNIHSTHFLFFQTHLSDTPGSRNKIIY